jgi:hypothetical protein
MKEYAVIFERTTTGWSAYVPDLPGLGVAGPTYEATEQLIREKASPSTSKAYEPTATPSLNPPPA